MKTNFQRSFLFLSLILIFSLNNSFADTKTIPRSYFMAIGYNGVIYQSSGDKTINWVKSSFQNESQHFSSIAYGNNRFVLITLGCSAWVSPDGWDGNWKGLNMDSQFEPYPEVKRLSAVAYGNNRFVATGYLSGNKTESGIFYTLADNETIWSRQQHPGPFAINGITYGKNGFLAVGTNISTNNAQLFTLDNNGRLLKTFSLPKIRPLNAVTYGRGVFLAVGLEGQIYSWDGVRKRTSYKLDGVNNLLGVTYADNKFVTVGFGGKVHYSTTGESKKSWKTTTIPDVFSLYSIAYGNGLFVATGMNTNNKGDIWWSNDLIAWHRSGLNSRALMAITFKP